MDFSIPESLNRLLEVVRKFVKDELEPIGQQVEEEDRIPQQIIDKMREVGLFGFAIPKKYGGLGLNTLGECLINQELSKTNGCFRSLVGTNNGLCSTSLICDGTPEQAQRYLPKLARGEMIGCFALSEEEAGSDAANISTTAELRGDSWALNGSKQFVTNGDIADFAVVFAVTDPKKPAKSGISAFLVEKDFPGFYRGKVERLMGLRGVHSCQFVLAECKVPFENLIGGEAMINRGFKTAMTAVDKGRLTMGAVALGSAEKLLELSLDYAMQRKQFNKPIVKFQLVQRMLSQMATEIYAARQMLYHAAWLRDQMKQPVAKEAAMVKLFCTEMACRVADLAVQVHGAMGYVRDKPIERFYRDLRLTRIYEGTSEIQHIVIARELEKEAHIRLEKNQQCKMQ